jgi:hypothetical protein
MASSLEELLEESIRHIVQRLSTAEEEFIKIAGERLKAIGVLSSEEARNYLFSLDAGEDQLSDLNKIRRVLLEAHNANINDLARAYNQMLGIVSDDTEDFEDETKINPPEKGNKADPLLAGLVGFYATMAKSTNVDETYKKTLNGLVASMIGDEDKINYASNMSKAIEKLAGNGISAIDPKSGNQVRLDSYVGNNIKNEFNDVTVKLEREAAGNETTGWEISVHFAPAEDHEDVQGCIFTNEEFEKLQNHEDAVDIDGGQYQLDRAIGEWNCQHYARPFMIGVSEPRYTQKELREIRSENDEGVFFNGEHYSLYEADQMHWQLEREIQKEKENNILQKARKDIDPLQKRKFEKSNNRLFGLRDQYNELGEKLGHMTLDQRIERTYGIKGIWDGIVTGHSFTKGDLVRSALEREGKYSTRVGALFQSHNMLNTASRNNTFIGIPGSGHINNTKMGLLHLQKLLNSSNVKYKRLPKKKMEKRGGKIVTGMIQVRLPNGEGALWALDGSYLFCLLSKI